MKQAKKIINTIRAAVYLIAFTGLAFWGWKQWQMVQEQKTGTERKETEQGSEAYYINQSEHIVLVTYFTSDQRCKTCKTIEQLTHEAVTEAFGPQLKSKELIFQTLNFDQAENSHYIDQYQLAFKTVVVSERKKGKEAQWSKYDQIWELVDKPEEFKSYLQNGIRQYLNTAATDTTPSDA